MGELEGGVGVVSGGMVVGFLQRASNSVDTKSLEHPLVPNELVQSALASYNTEHASR